MAQITENYSQLESFQNYVQTHSTEVWSKMFYRFFTASIGSVESGIKGKRTLPLLTIGDNLSKRWTSDFGDSPNNDGKVVWGQRVLETFLNKLEFSFVPTEWENNYMGFLRRSGQDPMDFPFEAFVMMKIVQKQRKEFEDAVWQAVQAGVPADTDPMQATFDGFLQIIADEITATNISPVITGAITPANILEKIRDMWAVVDTAYKTDAEMAILMDFADFDTYRIAYKELYHQSPSTAPQTGTDYPGVLFELGGGRVRIIPVPGLGTSKRKIITPLSNLVLGFDGVENLNLNVEQNHWRLDIFGAYRIGVQFRTLEEGVLVVNDQA